MASREGKEEKEETGTPRRNEQLQPEETTPGAWKREVQKCRREQREGERDVVTQSFSAASPRGDVHRMLPQEVQHPWGG